ncbi:glycoside hydrolase family 43 protein [Kineococcus sp. SYSU DK003]|uniref:glycoside hydrolase family 43 protein n=1 Tax=Kineococcus sp. SYSU DK003 TaxID=3383124 RepID=UPI003D7D46FD
MLSNGDGEPRDHYLFVHHVEDPDGHGEQVFFSLSEGDDPLFWRRANGGRPVLEPTLGTTGIRDPFVVRGNGEFFVVATDLRIYGGDDAGWDSWRRQGSRSIVVWRSVDLVQWSQPWQLQVAPPNAGMAWAPEATFDPATGEFTLLWSSALYADQAREGDGYSRVLTARTRDFRTIGPAEVLIDRGRAVIDTTLARCGQAWLRFSKDDSRAPDSLRLFAEVDRGDGFEVVAQRIADELFPDVEAPVVVHDARRDRWYLFVDQYSVRPQGYLPLTTDDPLGGRWIPVPAGEYSIPPNTKHGGVLPVSEQEWRRLAAAFPA